MRSPALLKSVFAFGVALALGAPAQAQDSWTGIYAGGSVGYTWDNINWDYYNLPGQSVPRSPSGFVGGVHFGYQQQLGQIVLGAELSVSGGRFLNERGPDAPVFAPGFDANSQAKPVLTIGPRLGWAINRNWMAYATGGYARTSYFTEFYAKGFPDVSSKGFSNHEGWYAGGGLEYAMTKNWIVGLEYQHMEFNTRLQSITVIPATGSARYVSGDADVVRARLTFKLGPKGLE